MGYLNMCVCRDRKLQMQCHLEQMTAAATCVKRQTKEMSSLHSNGCTLELNASQLVPEWHRGYANSASIGTRILLAVTFFLSSFFSFLFATTADRM